MNSVNLRCLHGFELINIFMLADSLFLLKRERERERETLSRITISLRTPPVCTCTYKTFVQENIIIRRKLLIIIYTGFIFGAINYFIVSGLVRSYEC